MDYGHWDISTVGEFDPTEWFGFIYLIEETSTGKGYIGKKFFQVKRQKTKNDKSRTKASGWQTYTSSSELLNDLISERGKEAFAFHILRLCTGRCELSYSEEEAQVTHDVLRTRLPNGERKYFNRTIGYKNFAGLEKQSEESKRKVSEALKGVPKTPEHNEANRQAHIGVPHTVETRMRQSAAQKGTPWSDNRRAAQPETIPYWSRKRGAKKALDIPTVI